MRLLSMFLILLGFSASAETNLLQNASMVNSASYEPRISPDSLITFLGKGFLSIHRLEFRFPSMPAAMTVDCRILYKTAHQINCHLPPVPLMRDLAVDVRAFHFTGTPIGYLRTTLHRVSPGIFTENQQGSGHLAAQFIFVTHASHAQEIVHVATWNSSRYTMEPFVLSTSYLAGRHPYLAIFGTGLAHAAGANPCALGGQLTVSVGSQNVPILYVGPTGGIPRSGVQQINVDLGGLPTSHTQTDLPVEISVTDCSGIPQKSNLGVLTIGP